MSEVAQATKEPLVMFTIYDHPADYPGHFVCRRWFCFPNEEVPRAEVPVFHIDPDLGQLRDYLFNCVPGLVRLGRCEGDDPKILETWL